MYCDENNEGKGNSEPDEHAIASALTEKNVRCSHNEYHRSNFALFLRIAGDAWLSVHGASLSFHIFLLMDPRLHNATSTKNHLMVLKLKFPERVGQTNGSEKE
jgi:hypothetical protein